MKKIILLFLSTLFLLPRANSQIITGSASVCTGSTTALVGAPSGLLWSSSAPSVASVSSSGVVTGLAVGTAVITYGTSPYVTRVVTVSAPPAITGVAASCVGGTTTLFCTPAGGTWSSSTPGIATINSTGVVSGLASGLTTITYASPGCRSTAAVGVTTCCSGIPAPGTAYPNVTSACVTTTVTLTSTGSAAGTTLQWQKSPDSLSWTDIWSATSSTYSFVGLTATTYYRCKVICAASGGFASTAGFKINSYVCCGGSPISAGAASASTTYCSSCSLTLNLTGSTTAFDISNQWQYSSYSGGPWTNLPGATSTSYTYSPDGAYYYRCGVTCGGVSAYCAPIFVGYQYLITADSISPASSSCLSTFSTVANGISPLLYLKTYYGDGTKDSLPCTPSGSISTAGSVHPYPYSGIYPVKKILYYNNIPQDSTSYVRPFDCKAFPIKLYFDADGDCDKGISELWNVAPAQIKVDSNGIAIDTLTATSGIYYSPLGNPGDVYSFSLLPGAMAVTCPASGIIYDTVAAAMTVYPERRFAVNCGSAGADFIVGNVVQGTGRHQQVGHIYVLNGYCTPDSSTVTFNFSPRYSGGTIPGVTNPSPVSVVGNTISWNIASLSLFSPIADICYGVKTPVSTSTWLIPGDTVQQRIRVSPASGADGYPSNNINVRIDTVRAGYDPNYIEVTPPGCFETDDLLQLQYTVHFENTGNDTAHNIYVLDTLSDYLDVRSLNIVMASHNMDLGIYQFGPYTVAKFDFPNIKLLDSSHHGLCDGAVIYTINAKPGIPVGQSIKARAGIYFDINEVVMTNTAEKLKGCPAPAGVSGPSHSKPALFPNPVSDELVVRADQNSFSSFTITNSIGQEIIQKQINNAQTRVNVKVLAPGIYYVVFTGAHGREVVKFVKE